MNKHTQGEWREGLLQGYLWTDVLNDDGHQVIAKVRTHRMTGVYQSEVGAEGMANLALVRAAPKLLAALEAILDYAITGVEELRRFGPNFLKDVVEGKAAIEAADAAIREARWGEETEP